MAANVLCYRPLFFYHAKKKAGHRPTFIKEFDQDSTRFGLDRIRQLVFSWLDLGCVGVGAGLVLRRYQHPKWAGEQEREGWGEWGR